jgi:hypothetical protein
MTAFSGFGAVVPRSTIRRIGFTVCLDTSDAGMCQALGCVAFVEDMVERVKEEGKAGS